MPEIKSRADSLRVYLTGAASDGAAQTDPDLSLGGYRSATEAIGLGVIAGAQIRPLRVDHASAANGVGTGTIRVSDANTITWTPPGSTVGAGVTISNGQSKIVEGSSPYSFVRVTRVSADNLADIMDLTLVDSMNNAIGGDNVTSAEATAGVTNYRGVMLYNESAFYVDSIKVWVVAPASGFSIGIESPTANAIQTIASETTAPTAVSFSTPTTEGGAVSIGSLAPGGMYGLWVRRTTSAGASYSPSTLNHLRFSFVANSY